MNIVGLDVGGANLKAADGRGKALTQPFALWKEPDRLIGHLKALLVEFSAYETLAVTMTGELCDCFESSRLGVLAILEAVATITRGIPVQVWTTEGRFASLTEARQDPLKAAAANWLALATFAGRFAPAGPALLLDIGSTTTDVIPLHDGQPIPKARVDWQRLQHGELVYQGAKRTPVCAVLRKVAAEMFATTRDAYLLLGMVPEDPNDRDTADSRPATREAAHRRLARMICGDPETVTRAQARQLARKVMERQLKRLGEAVFKVVPDSHAPLILAGSGEFLGRVLAQARGPFVSLSDTLGPAISRAACAHAVAVLAGERGCGH